MTIAGAIGQFLDSTVRRRPGTASYKQSLMLLAEYLSPDAELSEITTSRLRDFISRCYVEEACASKTDDSNSEQRESEQANSEALKPDQTTDRVPKPQQLLDALSSFFKWSDRETSAGQETQLSPVLSELQVSLPRAIEISQALSRSLRERGGAFSFPEFLTSFENGGSSQYDIDVPGHVGAIDGYFRIVRVEGSSVEAVELISEEPVWPILFPSEIASILEPEYIISLELVRATSGWEIAGCGFAYPPRTELS